MKKSLFDDLIKNESDLYKFYECKKYIINIDGIRYESPYIVTSNGKIFSTHKSKIKEIKPVKQKNGYYLVHLHINKKSYYRWHHRIVAETFIPNPENKKQVNHKDGNKSHNYVDNLEWTTPKENVAHAFSNNLRKCGENSSHTVLSEKTVRKICKMLEENKLTMHEIADKVNAQYYIVFYIKKKKFWKEVSKDYNIDNYTKTDFARKKCTILTEKDIHKICKELAKGEKSMAQIGRDFGVSPSAISSIKYGKTWKAISSKYFK